MKRIKSASPAIRIAGLVLAMFTATAFSNSGYAASVARGDFGFYRAEKAQKTVSPEQREEFKQVRQQQAAALASSTSTSTASDSNVNSDTRNPNTGNREENNNGGQDDDKQEENEEELDITKDTIFDAEFMALVESKYRIGRPKGRNGARDQFYKDRLAKAFRHAYNGLKHLGMIGKEDNEFGGLHMTPAYPKKKTNATPLSFEDNAALTARLLESGGPASLGIKFQVVDLDIAEDDKNSHICGFSAGNFDGFFYVAMTANGPANSQWNTIVNPDGSQTEEVKKCLNKSKVTPFVTAAGGNKEVHYAGHHDYLMIEAVLLMIAKGEAVHPNAKFSLRLQGGEKASKALLEQIKTAPVVEGAKLTDADFIIL